MYFDADAGGAFLGTGTDWGSLTPGQWDEMFSPGALAASKPGAFILRPVDGRARYLRRGKNARKGDEDAIHEAGVELDEVTLHVSSTWGCVVETPYPEP